MTGDTLKIDCRSALLVKLRGLKVIADIQKYFLEQVNVREKLNDIQDDDYDDGHNKRENIEEKISALERESNNISKHINQIIEARNSIDRLCLPQEMFNELKAVDKNNFADFKFSTLKELNWTNSALLPKIVFCHNGRKFRVLHSFALFTPEKYLKRDNDKTSVHYGQNIAEHANSIDQNTQQGIFKNAFQRHIYNLDGVGIKDFPDKTVFSGNKIPTFVGHEGTKRDEKRDFIMKKQSPQVFCVDENSFTGSGYTYIVDDGNTIQGYVTYNTINQKEKRCQDCTIYRTREVGDKVQDEWQRMVPCWTRTASSDDMLKYINSYIDIGGDDCGVAETIMALKNREKTDGNGAETYLKKCERYFAFLDKDRRSQQVFQTYRILAEGQQGFDFTSNTLNTKPTMVSLQDIGSINCGVSCC